MVFGGETLLGIDASRLGAVAAVVLVAALCHLIFRRLVQRKVARDQATGAGTQVRTLLYWIDAALTDTLAPLSALIWVGGLYAVVSLLAPAVMTLPGGVTIVGVIHRLIGILLVATLVWFMARLGRSIERCLAPVPGASANAWDDVLLPMGGKAIRWLLPLVALMLGVPALSVAAGYETLVRNAVSLALIGTASAILFQFVEAMEAMVLRRYRLDVGDNLEARAVHTQVTVLKKVASVIIAIFTLASMLMVFDSVRQFGTSILASAGIAGIIVGFAAQRSIATLLAGLQIAITQPIRIDDVVIVENEWGRIEEITLTYVVVRIWDQRRLVLPITYFIEQPFQNWTRTSSEILGTVFLHVDYRAPLGPLREELDRILDASPHWDRRVKVLQVVEAREHTIEIRALASAADASRAWDLRCEVREKLIAFLQQNYPESLPRVRAELHPPLTAAAPAGAVLQ